jgi:hypothetical protein
MLHEIFESRYGEHMRELRSILYLKSQPNELAGGGYGSYSGN